MAATVKLSRLDVSGLLRSAGLRPKKGLGQNFLVEPSTLQQIVDSAGLNENDSVLEIGPGLGSLTRYLARTVRRVVAVELDGALIPVLNEVMAGDTNVEIIHSDILKVDPGGLNLEDGYKVVANIPYYITSAVIRHLLEAPVKPSSMVLTMQKEVAARICALPGELSLLALSVQVYGKPRTVLHIPAGAFFPAPTVDSASLRVDLYPQPLIPQEQIETFFMLAKAGYSQKRKTLRNSLSAVLRWPPERAAAMLTAAGIDPMRRAETLSIEEWRVLTQTYLDLR